VYCVRALDAFCVNHVGLTEPVNMHCVELCNRVELTESVNILVVHCLIDIRLGKALLVECSTG
jgi:hypothetical protein